MSLPERGGRHFQPCRKCDYLFNHTSGKVSRGTEVEDLCVKKITGRDSVRAVMDQKIYSRLFLLLPVSITETERR